MSRGLPDLESATIAGEIAVVRTAGHTITLEVVVPRNGETILSFSEGDEIHLVPQRDAIQIDDELGGVSTSELDSHIADAYEEGRLDPREDIIDDAVDDAIRDERGRAVNAFNQANDAIWRLLDAHLNVSIPSKHNVETLKNQVYNILSQQRDGLEK